MQLLGKLYRASCVRGPARKMKSCHKPQAASILAIKYHNNAQTPLDKRQNIYLSKKYLFEFIVILPLLK